jgi:hypothetical protein
MRFVCTDTSLLCNRGGGNTGRRCKPSELHGQRRRIVPEPESGVVEDNRLAGCQSTLTQLRSAGSTAHHVVPGSQAEHVLKRKRRPLPLLLAARRTHVTQPCPHAGRDDSAKHLARVADVLLWLRPALCAVCVVHFAQVARCLDVKAVTAACCRCRPTNKVLE